jgi:hypothetical protein
MYKMEHISMELNFESLNTKSLDQLFKMCPLKGFLCAILFEIGLSPRDVSKAVNLDEIFLEQYRAHIIACGLINIRTV